ncbi:MAG: phosphate/phosphite/phosphonate ABC transporter substrate-binding protein, partial [Anaerolineae bacterium]
MHRVKLLLGVVLLVVLLVPSACSSDQNQPQDQAQSQDEQASAPADVELVEPVEEEGSAADEGGVSTEPEAGGLGTEAHPIVMSFVPSGEQEDIVTGGEDIAALLSAETGLVIEANVATNYAAVIEAMGAENAHVAWLNTFNYLLANERFGAVPLLVTSRYGTTSYAGQILTRAGSGIESLADLAGTKFCRPDQLSTSGWVIPSIMLKAAGIEESDLGEIIEAGNHDGVVTAIYNGDCEAGATYVDARDGVEETLPDVKELVVVIAVSDDIPNDNVSVIASLPDELAERIKDGLLVIASTEAGQQALQTTYGIEA